MKNVLSSALKIICIVFISLLSLHSYSQEQFGGMTLYTVRDAMAKDPEATLKKISETGYKYIEAAGYDNGKFYGMEPVEFKALMEKYNLIPLSSHQGSVTLMNADEQIKDVKAAGFKYFVIPVPPAGNFKYDNATKTMSMGDDVKFLATMFNTIGKKAKEAGLELLYHNHNFEFEKNKNGIVPMDYFLENTDPEYVNFQMDLYWITKAQKDPVEYFKKYPGRFKLWHIKDMDKEGKFAPVGMGTINFKNIYKKHKLAGLDYYIVEQDNTYDLDPFEALKISHDNLKKAELKKMKYQGL